MIADSADHVRSALRLALCQIPGLIVVGEAASAQEAIAQATAHRPDLALLEWELPGQNGGPTVASLRAARCGMVIIVISTRLETRTAALAAGADGFASKLDPPDRLLLAVGKSGVTGEWVSRRTLEGEL